MHYRIRTEAIESISHLGVVTDVGSEKPITRVPFDRYKGTEITRVSEFINNKYLVSCMTDEVPDQR